jgi:hypothetical protein
MKYEIKEERSAKFFRIWYLGLKQKKNQYNCTEACQQALFLTHSHVYILVIIH